jgi:hypothetical protein
VKAIEENIVVEEDGLIQLDALPVKAGDRVKVILLIPEQGQDGTLYPLRGTQPYRFDDPTSPVAPEDWEPGT